MLGLEPCHDANIEAAEGDEEEAAVGGLMTTVFRFRSEVLGFRVQDLGFGV
jgi:hypothetical protein